MAPGLPNQPEVEGEIVDRGYLHGQQLAADEEVTQKRF